MKILSGFVVIVSILGLAGVSIAGPINWVADWTIVSNGATGLVSQQGTLVEVTYSGHASSLAPASYWSEGSPAPYTGNPVVDNAPISGVTLVAANSSSPNYANVLTFSSPLIDPVFALYSVGRSSLPVPYEFDQGFTLLSEGYGTWGDGSFVIDGNTLTGYEGHGVIQFIGAISSIAWNNPVAENHHGFTLGVTELIVSVEQRSLDAIKSNYR